MKCWWAKDLWSRIGISPSLLDIDLHSMMDWLWLCAEKYPRDTLIKICCGARLIWYNRNRVIHGEGALDVVWATKSMIDKMRLIKQPTFKFSISSDADDEGWTAPEEVALKLNCDGAWDHNSSVAGCGCIVRDSERVIRGVLASVVMGVTSSVHAEGWAVLFAMKWAMNAGWKDCIFETDCSYVYDMIYRRRLDLSGADWVAECADLLVNFDGWKLNLIRREANGAADVIARKALRENWNWSSLVAIPMFVGSLTD